MTMDAKRRLSDDVGTPSVTFNVGNGEVVADVEEGIGDEPVAKGAWRGFANDRLLLDSDQVHRFVWPDLGAADGRSQSSLTNMCNGSSSNLHVFTVCHLTV